MKKVSIIAAIILTTTSFLLGQTAPTASNITIIGEAYYNSTANTGTKLTVIYDFNDIIDKNTETGGTIVTWYTSPTNETPTLTQVKQNTLSQIANEPLRYELAETDIDKYLYVSITPVDDGTSNTIGLETFSPDSSAILIKDAAIEGITSVVKQDATDGSGGVYKYLDLQIKNNKYYTVTNGSTVHIYGDLYKEAGDGAQHVTFNITGNSTVIVYGQFIAKDLMTINVETGSTLTIVSGIEAQDGATLDISGSLSVDGNITVEDDAAFIIAPGGSLDIDGDLSLGDGGSLTIEGDMGVGGDFDAGTGTTIAVDLNDDGTGTLNIGGDLTGEAFITGEGPITVGGTVGTDIVDTDDNGQITTLPIELTHFAATQNENEVTLYWQTASEDNNHYFTIERSVDGVSFETIGTVMGAGNSQTTLNYSFTDVSPLVGTTYYRLQQTDFDGKFEIFNMVSVSFYNEGNLNVFPIPATNSLTIDFGGLTAQSQIQLMNIHGQVVKSLSVWESVQTIDVSDLAAGNYLLTILNGNQPLVKRIVIQ
ncbi:MAG: T9SS type A sorting domain-containing protein [Salinivirgaceae bacterium]